MQTAGSGSKVGGISLLLLAPASLTIGSGDPTIPNLGGIIIAFAALTFGIRVFKRATTGAVVFLIVVGVLAIVAWPFSPNWGWGTPGRGTTAVGWMLYLAVVKPGGVIALALVALSAILRVRRHERLAREQDLPVCMECGMLPPGHKAWCVLARGTKSGVILLFLIGAACGGDGPRPPLLLLNEAECQVHILSANRNPVVEPCVQYVGHRPGIAAEAPAGMLFIDQVDTLASRLASFGFSAPHFNPSDTVAVLVGSNATGAGARVSRLTVSDVAFTGRLRTEEGSQDHRWNCVYQVQQSARVTDGGTVEKVDPGLFVAVVLLPRELATLCDAFDRSER